MIRKLLAACLLVTASLSAVAGGCTTKDAWRGQDKNGHALVGGVAGLAGSLETKSFWGGVATGAAVGAAKEIVDVTTGNGFCSLQDFLVTAAAGAAGAATGGLLLTYAEGTTTFWLVKRF